MSPERAIICACGVVLCAIWGYLTGGPHPLDRKTQELS